MVPTVLAWQAGRESSTNAQEERRGAMRGSGVDEQHALAGRLCEASRGGGGAVEQQEQHGREGEAGVMEAWAWSSTGLRLVQGEGQRRK